MSTVHACSWRWLAGAALALALAVPAIGAQEWQPSAPANEAGVNTRVEQHVSLDEAQSLSLQYARAAEYKTPTPLERLQMEGKTVWPRLSLIMVWKTLMHFSNLYLAVFQFFCTSEICTSVV